MKSQYLHCALGFAKMLMPSSKKWDKCCQEAINVLSLSGVSVAGFSRSVHNFYLDLVKNKRKFHVRLPKDHKLPMFLDLNREVKKIYCIVRRTWTSYQSSSFLNTYMIHWCLCW
jgi:hypothetical protein